jgi:hypothetical protein
MKSLKEIKEALSINLSSKNNFINSDNELSIDKIYHGTIEIIEGSWIKEIFIYKNNYKSLIISSDKEEFIYLLTNLILK